MKKGIGLLVVGVQNMVAEWPQKIGKIIIGVLTPTLPSDNDSLWWNMEHLLKSSCIH
jgi:hypothetical protein